MNETRRAVLAALDEGPVPGPVLADRLGVTRTAVWKHVEALREAGFSIRSDGDGYVLEGAPEFGPGVGYGQDAFEVEYHETIPSTNDRARKLAAAGVEDVVVLADEQTAGRGRLDREWIGPSGGVWASLVLRPDLPPAHAPLLTLAAAVAVARTVGGVLEGAGESDVSVGLKWPNDVLLAVDGEEHKLAGVLTEMEGETDEVSWVVIGIGLNANVDEAALPAGATSLSAVVGPVNRRELVGRLLDELDSLRGNPDAVLPAWRELSFTLGRHVRVDTPRGVVEGEAVDVEFPGTLVVATGGDRVHVHAGDCHHLRPA